MPERRRSPPPLFPRCDEFSSPLCSVARTSWPAPPLRVMPLTLSAAEHNFLEVWRASQFENDVFFVCVGGDVSENPLHPLALLCTVQDGEDDAIGSVSREGSIPETGQVRSEVIFTFYVLLSVGCFVVFASCFSKCFCALAFHTQPTQLFSSLFTRSSSLAPSSWFYLLDFISHLLSVLLLRLLTFLTPPSS